MLSITIPIALPSLINVRLVSTPLANQSLYDGHSQAGPSTLPISQTAVSSTPALELSHLPAITTRIHLPPSYPLCDPPRITSIRASLPQNQHGSWLNKSALAAIQSRLNGMWEEEKSASGEAEGNGVLWRWWEWVGGGEFLVDLGMMIGDVLE